jgi:hypothetical protein
VQPELSKPGTRLLIYTRKDTDFIGMLANGGPRPAQPQASAATFGHYKNSACLLLGSGAPLGMLNEAHHNMFPPIPLTFNRHQPPCRGSTRQIESVSEGVLSLKLCNETSHLQAAARSGEVAAAGIVISSNNKPTINNTTTPQSLLVKMEQKYS